MPRRLFSLLALSLAGCDAGLLRLRVVDEGGTPISGATVETPSSRWITGADGIVLVTPEERPALATVSAATFLAEPVPLGAAESGTVDVRLLSSSGRFVLHSTGDVMMGRRYVTPEEGAPLLDPADDGESAEALVSDIAPALALADLVTVNLETVVGDFTDDEAYPGKRWLLQTPPSALSAFGPLGVDVAGLANNHQRDWMDAGVTSTLAELDARRVAHVGSGEDADTALDPLILDVDGVRVGIVAYTSVDGDYVNDQYPLDGDAAPDPLPADTAFQWEPRTWGAPEYGVDVADRRIGSAWAAIEDAEDQLSDTDRAALWASAVAVYPELQDWVARRGHGGAARWDDDAPARIAAVRERVDLLVVQLHMGYQFAAVPGEGVKDAAYAAVDAGADLVVCHHPHVLQGFEWYQDKLIAWSLGNFLFDQDFLSTFRSAFLRTVWEGGTLVQARIVPMMLDRYRPVPVVDGTGRDVARLLYEASLTDARSKRGDDLGVRPVAEGDGAPGPGFVFEHGTARLTDGAPDAERVEVSVGSTGIAALPRDALVRRRLVDDPAGGVLVGRDVSGFGSFEDESADVVAGAPEAALAWTWSSDDIVLDTLKPLAGRASLVYARDRWNDERVSARMIARVPLPAHRLYADGDGLVPRDGDATYSVRLLARREGDPATLTVRLVLYYFDDLNPTEDPESTVLGEVELSAEPGTATGELLLDVDPSAFAPVGGLRPNAALLYVSVEPPEAGASVVRVDDVALIEWRPAAEEPSGWGALDWVRAPAGTTLEVDVLPM